MGTRRGMAIAAACALVMGCQPVDPRPQPLAGADVGEGLRLIEAVGCGACHVIPRVAWPKGRVAPSLEGFADRGLIAGRFPNQPEILARFVRDAPALSPQTGMPPMPLTEQEARDVAAYLYTLDAR